MLQRGPQRPPCLFDQVPPPGSKRLQAEAISRPEWVGICGRIGAWNSERPGDRPTDKGRRREHSPQPATLLDEPGFWAPSPQSLAPGFGASLLLGSAA